MVDQRRYRTRRELGRGADSVVTLELDTHTGVLVARKALAAQSSQAVSLKHEFRRLADVSHPNLVQLFELIDDDGEVAFTMESIDGEDIGSYARAHPEELRQLFVQVLLGCNALFSHGLLHRDLKPSNMLVERGRVVLLDFGLSMYLDGEHNEDGFTGTFRYAAPEQFMGQPLTAATDLFAAAMVFAEILGVDITSRTLNQSPALPTEVHPDSALTQLIQDLLSPKPAQRPTVSEALRRLAHNGPETTTALRFIGDPGRIVEAAGCRGIGVVRGESGAGKTRFLQEVSRLKRSDGLVLQGSCRHREQIAFQPLDEIAESLALLLPNVGLTPLERAALGDAFAPFGRPSLDTEGDPILKRGALVSGLGRCIRAACTANKLTLVIDDFQWADPDSIAVLRSLIDSGYLGEATLLLGVRSDDTTAIDQLGESVCALSWFDLEPLDDDATRAALRAAKLPEPAIEAAVAAASGSPFLLAEAVQLFASEGRPLKETSIVQQRLATVDSAFRMLIDLISLSDGPLSSELVGEALGSDASPYYDLVRLEAGAWVKATFRSGRKRYEPYHARIRDEVRASLTDQMRLRLHRRLIAGFEGCEPENFAALMVHSEGAGEVERACEYGLRAGRQAQQRLAFDSAQDFFSRTQELGGLRSSLTHELALRHAQVLYNLGECRAAAERAASAPPGAYLSPNETAALTADAWISAGELEAGISAIGVMIPSRRMRQPGRRHLWVRLLSQLLWLRWTSIDRPRPQSSDPLPLAEIYWSLGKLNMISTKHGTYFQLASLTAARGAGSLNQLARGLAVLANVCRHVGLFADFGDRCMDRAMRIARDEDDPYLLGVCLLWSCHRAMAVHEWQEAGRLADQAVGEMENRHFGLAWECTTARNFRLMCLEKEGRIAELLGLADGFLRVAEARRDAYSATLFSLFSVFWRIQRRPATATMQALRTIQTGWRRSEFSVQQFYLERAAVFCSLHHRDVSGATNRLEQLWPILRRSDVLDIASSAIDAYVMLGLVLLHTSVEKRDWGWRRRWHQTLIGLQRGGKEGRGYRKYLLGLLARQQDSIGAEQWLGAARAAFEEIGVVTPLEYIDFATARSRAGEHTEQWCRTMTAL